MKRSRVDYQATIAEKPIPAPTQIVLTTYLGHSQIDERLQELALSNYNLERTSALSAKQLE